MNRMDAMLDDIDRKILHKLQENARVSNADIAREVGMAPSATLERMRKLEERGIIRGYSVLLDPVQVDWGTLAFVYVRSNDGCWCVETFAKLAELPEVLECHSIAGEDCFLIKIRARSTVHLNEILRYKIAAIPSVINTRTTIVLESNKETLNVPLAGDLS